ncbi:Alpha/beta hydrolase [Pleurostoma richardsiae]|uniref:Alpha/beta hydrolase n=1 Tax=Pleurostoma richardsiae TaxID=41990 RepID=A0AA38RM90_9PEZI|nr:Alpha/beta hydrolase [Pleurostoma richardsiae]
MAEESVESRNFFPGLQRHATPTASGSTIVSYTSDLGPDTPILTLIHGYPQSAFIWRYLVPALVDKISLFVPELPGYGISSPAPDSSKLVVGGGLLEALQSTFGISESSPRKLILGGHDRGARICHRLAVHKDRFPAFKIVATILLDIVPTKIQWDKFQNPAVAQAYFHWPLLANVDLAVQLITAFGGANWCRGALRLAGNQEGLRRLTADGAVDAYAALFSKAETIRHSCEDYAASAGPEYAEQAAEQEAGRKIDVPALVAFSQANLGARIDVAEEWKDWIAPGTPYEPVAVGEGYGHYLPEEAHDIVASRITEFLARYV